MAGHSKWANIQHRKGAQDARRAKLFTRLIREIKVAARAGGEDPATNPRLRLAINKAQLGNMNKDTIERAVRQGAPGDEAAYETVRYEGYGTGGVAIIVDCLTDNINRTVAEVRHALTKYGGKLGTNGSVAYLFNRVGILWYADTVDEDTLMHQAIEADAADVERQADGYCVTTSAESLLEIQETLQAGGLVAESAEIVMQPATLIELSADQQETITNMLQMLDNLDDTQQVSHNAKLEPPQ